MSVSRAGEKFAEGDYDGCTAELEKVKDTKASDFKVLHNLEVCQGYKVSFANPKELLAKLQSIKADVDQKRNEGSENEDFAFDDVDTAILNSNIAVLALQLRKYATATQALDRLFRNIEPLDELLAARICVMLLDSLSVQRLPEKAVQVLNFLEKTIQALFVSKASSDSTNESQDANPAASAEFQKYGFVSLPQLKILLSIYKAKHYLFHGNAKAAKREIKAAIAGSQPAELASPLMLKAHLEYLRGNFRKAQKLLCSSSLSDQPFRSFQLNNMGCLHYRSRKYGIAAMYFRRSIQELSKSNEQTERAKMEAISCVKREEVLYNLGLQNLLLGRPEAAFSCLREASRLLYNRPRLWIRLSECCIARHHLCTRQSDSRQACDLVKSVSGKGSRRRVLVPIGLASLRSRCVQCSPSNGSAKDENGEPSPGNGSDTAQSPSEHGAAAEVEGQMTMSFALQCLQNAFCLISRETPAMFGSSWGSAGSQAGTLNTSNEDADVDHANGNGSSSVGKDTDEQPAAAPNRLQGIDVRDGDSDWVDRESSENERWTLKQAILCKMAYVHLCLDNPVMSLRAVKRLLHVKLDLTRGDPARMYGTEALCLLEKCEEAVYMLEPLIQKDLIAADAISGCGQGQTPARRCSLSHMSEASGMVDTAAARSALHINLAAICVMQEKLKEAHQHVRIALNESPTCPAGLMIAVYLEIRKGNTAAALNILKHQRLMAS